MGVGIVETVDIAEKDQQVGLHQPGHNGGEGVVVAQDLALAGLNLCGVVLVYHGDDAQLQQGLKGIAQVLRPDGGVHILAGEKNLGHHPVILAKHLVIEMHDGALAHRGGGLLHPELAGPLLQPQLGTPHADGAGGDQHNLVAHALQIGQGPGQPVHIMQVQPAGVMGQGGCAYLYDYAQ